MKAAERPTASVALRPRSSGNSDFADGLQVSDGSYFRCCVGLKPIHRLFATVRGAANRNVLFVLQLLYQVI